MSFPTTWEESLGTVKSEEITLYLPVSVKGSSLTTVGALLQVAKLPPV